MPLREVIQKTYFTNLDLIPGNLDLMEFEHATPMALREQSGNYFFTRIGDVLAEVTGVPDHVGAVGGNGDDLEPAGGGGRCRRGHGL
ncbi:hypothetical protein GCM10017322_31700 [Paracoccus aerius]|nr:hypothetical protein GCM10017322_31700 [Paracoccus aerius]